MTHSRQVREVDTVQAAATLSGHGQQREEVQERGRGKQPQEEEEK